MIEVSVPASIETHPAVGPASVTCRKKALPPPAVAGQRFTSMTIA